MKKWITHFWEFVIAFVLVFLLVTSGPVVETYIYPVMKSDQTEIDKGIQTGENEVNIYGHAVRRRDCVFLELKWYYGKRGERAVSIRHVFHGPPKVRPKGVMEFGPWTLKISPSLLPDTYADAYHQCKIFGIPLPWISRSRFFN